MSKAFLDSLALDLWGDAMLTASNNGYDLLPSSKAKSIKTFEGYEDHPGLTVVSAKESSTEAGRYKIPYLAYTVAKRDLKLSDFGPESQDAVALRLALDAGAGPEIESGDFDAAKAKCAGLWPLKKSSS